MFKKARYIIAANSSIAAIGINTQSLNPSFRQGMIETAFQEGLTPQELAVFVAYQLPAAHQPNSMELIVAGWVQEGKVRAEAVTQARLARAPAIGELNKLID